MNTKHKLEIAVSALKDIKNPIEKMRKEADEKGGTLNGYACILSENAYYLKDIARKALEEIEEVKEWTKTQ